MANISLNGFIAELGGKRTAKGYFTRNHFIEIGEDFESQVEAYAKKCNYEDVYYCIYADERNTEKDSNIIGDFYLDFDVDELENEEVFQKLLFKVRNAITYLKTVFRVPEEDIKVFFSGSKGFHIIIPWQVLGLKPSPKLNDTFKIFAKDIAKQVGGIKKPGDSPTTPHVDLGIYDRRRLFRIPNTKNKKSGLYKVPLKFRSLYNLTYADLAVYANQPQKEEWREPKLNTDAARAWRFREAALKKAKPAEKKKGDFKIPDTIQELLPCAKILMERGAEEGQRNRSTFALASSLTCSGYKIDDIDPILQEWNEKLNDPPLSKDEVSITVHSAYSMVLNGRMCGCATYKDLGACAGKKCPLVVSRERK